MIPTSILLGLGAAPLWSAQCTYLTIMGNTQAEKVGKVGRDVVNQYFGIFFLIFQSSGVWGNLISSLVFGQTPTQGKREQGSVMAPERSLKMWFSAACAPASPGCQLFFRAVCVGLRGCLVHKCLSHSDPALPGAGRGLAEQCPWEMEGHCQWNLGS